jgi:nucleotide-binding universal stress UspA family protein
LICINDDFRLAGAELLHGYEKTTMKNILVLAGGGDSDHSVFATAFAAALPLGAHLEFFHVQVAPGDAAVWEPHAGFVRGPAMREMMLRLETESVMRTAAARDHFGQFCEDHKIIIMDQPRPGGVVSASWREETGNAERRLLSRARHYDLVVLGRRTAPNGLPPDLIEKILLGSGRPLLIAPPQSPRRLLGTVVVCWKETAEAARAIAAAMPLLINAERVVLAGVQEHDPSLAEGLADLARQLTWHGLSADTQILQSAAGSVRETLMTMASAEHADLLVMGGYGHSRAREILFGGFTQSILESAEIAVFLMH